MLTLGIIFIWLIIPDLIKGITLTCQNGFMFTLQESLRYPESLNVSSLTVSLSAITIFIYLMVIFVVLKLGAQQKLKMRIWEWIIFPVINVILAVTLFCHYYSLIDDLVILHGAEFNSKLIGNAVELFFISGVSLFIIIWYFTYYHRKYHRRLQINSAYQTWLNQEFMLIDDWNFVQAKICKIISDYLNRHENINGGCHNHHHILL